MTEFFRILTPATYWILIILWSFILQFYIRRMWGNKLEKLFTTLMIILAIDAFRSLFESIYFGAWYTSLAGLIPGAIATFLMRPEMVIIPKLINVAAAVVVIALLLRRWLPEEELAKSRSTEALLASEQKFKAFTSQSAEGISVADLEGNYIYANEAFCKMVGYSEDELLKMTVFDVTSDSQDKATFAKSIGVGEGTPIQVVLKKKNGIDFLAEVVGKNIKVGEDEHVLGVIRDITDRENLATEQRIHERQLLHSQKLESLGVLAGGIAHDFNNLLTAIQGNASLAMDELSPVSPARISLQEIQKASKRAANLSRQMLAYSGRGQFVIQVIDSKKLIEEITHLLEVSVSKKIELLYSFSKDARDFEGDATQISQVVMNLITNAAESIGDENGSISLSTGTMDCSRQYLDHVNMTLRASLNEPLPEGMYTFLEVGDTGCGMDPEIIDRIFDPFFTTKFTGRGLGMSAVLGIIRGHRGALNISSEVGTGTTIRVLFPVSENTAIRASGSFETRSENPDWQGNGTILVVDDEESILLLASKMLKRLGFDVLMAKDGVEAMKVHSEHLGEIDCTLLDLTMPKMDGKEVFRQIKIQEPEARIILSSGYSEEEATLEFTGKGLSGFISKPYQSSQLKALLSSVFNNRDA